MWLVDSSRQWSSQPPPLHTAQQCRGEGLLHTRHAAARVRARALSMATGMRARVSQIRWLLQQGASTVSPSARSRQPTSDLPQSPPSPPHHPA